MKPRLRVTGSWLASLAVIGFLGPLLLADLAIAGQQASGFIGQVKDDSGGVLPGVAVTAASPALQVREMTVVTDEKGEYRITPLPIGTYEITYALSGFQTVKREGLRLTQGFIARVDVALKVGGVAETITVSGASPVVDTTTTSTGTVLTLETLELTPTDRNSLLSLVSQTPGARGNLDVGGTALVTIPVMNAFGQVAESWQVVDGVVTTSFRSAGGQWGNYFDYTAFEETRTQTVANDAEMPRIGIFFSAIIKSGGNAFHGGASYSDTNGRFQSNNITPTLASQGITAPPNLNTRWDTGGDLGGKIIQDKLWFYSAVRKRRNDMNILNAFQPDGSPAVKIQDQSFTTAKLSYQVTPQQRLSSYLQYATKGELANTVTPFASWEQRAQQIWFAETGKLEWQYIRGDSLVTSLKYGHFHVHSRFEGFSDAVPAKDIKTTRVWGDGTNDGNISQDWNHDFDGTLSWYKPHLFAGSHQFKTGFDFVDGTDVTGGAGSPANQYQLIFNGGVPFELATFSWPFKAFVVVHYLGIYAQDSWRIAPRLTLNLGARYAHDNGFVPDQCRVAGMFAAAACLPGVQMNIWSTVAPRLHAAYDVSGDGKTVIKGGWGRFDHMREHSPELTNVNPLTATTPVYLWHDLNGDKLYEPGEVNLNLNGPDYVSISGLTNGVPNPNEQEPKIDEFAVSLERQLIPNLAVRITGLYTHTFNTYRSLNTPRPYSAYNIPITKPDPGPDGVLNTADDPGRSITYYAYPASLAGNAFAQTTLINDPNADQTYKSVELAATKRLSKGWQLMAAYTATKKHIPLGSDPPIAYNPNAEIFVANDTWEWETKISGAYMLPFGITASANFQNISGNPYARQVLFTTGGSTTVPTLLTNVELVSSRRLPSINMLDLRLDKAFTFAGNQKVTVRAMCFNSLNASTALSVQQQSGATFNQPTSILPPRIFEFGVSYAF